MPFLGRANSLLGLVLACFVPSLRAQDVLVEAESFADPGGWVLDQQFMDQMGSPYLLAHGLGAPVRDAVTKVSFPKAGPYRLWVRTRDWAAPRTGGEAPGRFQVLVNGVPAGTVFGTSGAEWHWQDGGTVEVGDGPATVVFRDLTGFEGRVDAVLFSADSGFVPPDGGKALEKWRRKALGLPENPEEGGSFDLVVVGGGIAGMCSAISAARNGLAVALVQDRPILGGNNSSEVRVWLGGETNQEPYTRIGDVVRELEPAKKAHYGPANTAELYEDDRRMAIVRAEKNITLVLDRRVCAVEKAGKTVRAVVAQDVRTGIRVRIAGKVFADCTGDGAVGALAGADYEATGKGHMGPSNLWHAVDTGSPSPFPRCPWAIDLSEKPFPGRDRNTGQWSKPGLESLGVWFWECGFGWDPVADAERMRDWNFLAMYGAWDALKNVDGVYPNHRLAWAAHISGKRESRRLLGDVVLSREDIVSGRPFADASFPCTWSIDLHSPHPAYAKGFEGREFISEATHDDYQKPYWVPYRVLYSRNIANLFMAGRDISVTHDALGIVRVMRTTGMMGEVVGMAAALCVRHRATPREVYAKHIRELMDMLKKGVPAGKNG